MRNERQDVVNDIALHTINKISQLVHDNKDLLDSKAESLSMMTIVAIIVCRQFLDVISSGLPELEIDDLSRKARAVVIHSVLAKLDAGADDMQLGDEMKPAVEAIMGIVLAIEEARLQAGLDTAHEIIEEVTGENVQ